MLTVEERIVHLKNKLCNYLILIYLNQLNLPDKLSVTL
jgi:hypothetical protein